MSLSMHHRSLERPGSNRNNIIYLTIFIILTLSLLQKVCAKNAILTNQVDLIIAKLATNVLLKWTTTARGPTTASESTTKSFLLISCFGFL